MKLFTIHDKRQPLNYVTNNEIEEASHCVRHFFYFACYIAYQSVWVSVCVFLLTHFFSLFSLQLILMLSLSLIWFIVYQCFYALVEVKVIISIQQLLMEIINNKFTAYRLSPHTQTHTHNANRSTKTQKAKKTKPY